MTRVTESPCCGWAVNPTVDAGTGVSVAYTCTRCGARMEACHTQQADGTMCERLAKGCRYHGDE